MLAGDLSCTPATAFVEGGAGAGALTGAAAAAGGGGAGAGGDGAVMHVSVFVIVPFSPVEKTAETVTVNVPVGTV
jgi:hypothetical protein